MAHETIGFNSCTPGTAGATGRGRFLALRHFSGLSKLPPRPQLFLSRAMSKGDAAFQKANSLFVDEDFSAALASYNEAIQADGNVAEYYIKRSACHGKLKNFTGNRSPTACNHSAKHLL